MSGEDRYDNTYIKDVKHEGMDPIQYVDLKNAFAYIDVDKSGSLDVKELKTELENAKEEAEALYPDLNVDEIIDMIMERCDKNKDGKITFKEMVEVFTNEEIKDIKNKKNTDKIYQEYCHDGDELDVDTLKKVAKELGEDPKECERMVFMADTDGDGIVSEEEFHAILNMSEEELMERAKAWKDYSKDTSKKASRKKGKK